MAELGPAQPQLVLDWVVTGKVVLDLSEIKTKSAKLELGLRMSLVISCYSNLIGAVSICRLCNFYSI